MQTDKKGIAVTALKTETLIKTMSDTIVKTAKPHKVVLFGSFATGKSTSFSDVDFLVIEETEFDEKNSRRKEIARILSALISYDIAKDVLVYSCNEVNLAEKNPMHVVSQALKYGKVLYERT
jgi:predicted nucleotidyltransferase